MVSRKLVHVVAVAGVAAAFVTFTGASGASAATNVGNVLLYNDTTELCADLPGTGAVPIRTPVWQDTCYFGGGDNQDFGMLDTRVVNGYQLFVLVNVKSQLCLDLPDRGVAGHLRLQLGERQPGMGHPEVNGMPGEREIFNYKDNLCLDVEGWASQGTDKGGEKPLDLYPCVGNSGPWLGGPYPTYDDHLWNLIPD